MEKILITGTGRSGTTFLIKLFSFLDYNTGFNRENYKNHIESKCNSGMEKKYTDNHYIIKNPTFMSDMAAILKNHNVIVKLVIIPIRDYKVAAVSRANLNYGWGGLWNASDECSQLLFYNEIMANYMYTMTKYEINTLFLDFDKMVNDKKYLFNKLKVVLDEKNINFELFSKVYDETTLTSKPH